MLYATSILVAALALGAQAAPFAPFWRTGHASGTASGTHGRHFKANSPSRYRNGHVKNAPEAMHRAYKKYGWEIVVVDPNQLADLLAGQGFEIPGAQSSAAVPTVAASTYAPVYATSEAVATNTANAGGAAPSSAPAADDDDIGSGEVVAVPEENESEYLSPVSIGGQTLQLDFDTGSSDLWVFSTDLPADHIGQHAAFDPTQSSTWEEYEGSSWEIRYGDGSGASGTVGFDVVKVGEVTATRQAVEVATAISEAFVADENNDGLLGLGFGTINTIEPQKQKTFFESILPDLDMPLFTADLHDDESGTYEFGAIDASKYVGEVHFVDIDSSNGFWQFPSPSYSVGGSTSACQTCSPVIADTGTSLMLLDDEIVQAYYAGVPDVSMSYTAGGYTYPCDAQLPDFALEMGGYMAVVKGSEMTYAQTSSTRCFGGLQSNSGGGLQILGDVFFKSYFAIFDGGNLRVGVAQQE